MTKSNIYQDGSSSSKSNTSSLNEESENSPCTSKISDYAAISDYNFPNISTSLDLSSATTNEQKIFQLNRIIAHQALQISKLKNYIETGEIAKHVLVNHHMVKTLHKSISIDAIHQEYAVLNMKFEDLQVENKNLKIEKIELEEEVDKLDDEIFELRDRLEDFEKETPSSVGDSRPNCMSPTARDQDMLDVELLSNHQMDRRTSYMTNELNE